MILAKDVSLEEGNLFVMAALKCTGVRLGGMPVDFTIVQDKRTSKAKGGG
jgi:hypothetical protein